MRRYRSERTAFLRVESLKNYGLWPAIRKIGNGLWEVVYDPEPWDL